MTYPDLEVSWPQSTPIRSRQTMACTLPTCLWKWRFPGTRPPPVWEPPVAVFTVQWQSQAVWQGLYGLQICKISPVWLFSESWPVTEMIPPIPSRSTILESWVLSSRFWYLIFLGLYSFALEWSKILHGLESPLISWTTSQKKVSWNSLNSTARVYQAYTIGQGLFYVVHGHFLPSSFQQSCE